MKIKHIMFLSYGGGHVNMLVPIIKYFSRCSIYKITVIGLTTACTRLKSDGITFYSFKDYVSLFPQHEVLRYGRRLADEGNQSADVPYSESVSYLGINYLELVETFGQKVASRMYRMNGRQIFYPFHSMKKILECINPDLLVATNSPRSEKAAINAAASLSIPSICLVDLFGFQEGKWISKPNFATKVCVLSDFVRDRFIDLGRSPDDLVVTGNPVFDKLSNFKDSLGFTNSKINLQSSFKKSLTILWASQSEPASHPFHPQKVGDSFLPRKVDEELFKIARNHPDFLIYIRLHPSENVEYVANQLPENVRVSSKNSDLHELISKVDLVITMTSTVAVEAALIGKPIVTVDMSIFTEDAPYSEMGLSRGVSSLKDLERAILEAVSMPVPKEEIERIVGKPGTATKNIISVIEDLLRPLHEKSLLTH